MEKKMSKITKRQQKVQSLLQGVQTCSLSESLDVLLQYKEQAAAKFDETVDVVFELGVDPKQSDQMVRVAVVMPNGLGKSVRVAVVTNQDNVKVALAAGADVAGAESFIEEMKAGKLDFDVLIATPDMMVQLSKLGRVLGPKGLMPNPRAGTVSEDIATAVKNVKSGQVECKTEKGGLIHAPIGKLSFSKESLMENFKAVYDAVVAAKPSASKGVYMRGGYISPSQGPAVKLDFARLMS